MKQQVPKLYVPYRYHTGTIVVMLNVTIDVFAAHEFQVPSIKIVLKDFNR